MAHFVINEQGKKEFSSTALLSGAEKALVEWSAFSAAWQQQQQSSVPSTAFLPSDPLSWCSTNLALQVCSQPPRHAAAQSLQLAAVGILKNAFRHISLEISLCWERPEHICSGSVIGFAFLTGWRSLSLRSWLPAHGEGSFYAKGEREEHAPRT